jgi:hypothetical protein
MIVVAKVVLYMPAAVRAHPGHGIEGVAASILLDAALSSEGGCTEQAS